MKRLLLSLLIISICTSVCVPAFAADYLYATTYTFGSGPDSNTTFGHSTGYDEPAIIDPLSTNTRRNKDAAEYAPSYGVFSGYIPTGPTSPYHTNKEPNPWSESIVIINGALAADTSIISGGAAYSGGGGAASGTAYITSGGTASGVTPASAGAGVSSLNTTYYEQPGLLPSTSVMATSNTAPWYYDDGSIGTLYVTKINRTVKVYEGEDLTNLKRGAGHFTSTSAWDGNVALAGHNRGSNAYFNFVKDLESGDTLTYTTLYGTRSYMVIAKTQINEYDSLPLSWSGENILTLITCVADVPENRFCVIASEIR